MMKKYYNSDSSQGETMKTVTVKEAHELTLKFQRGKISIPELLADPRYCMTRFDDRDLPKIGRAHV